MKKWMKVTALILAIAMVFSFLTACAGSKTAEKAPQGGDTAAAKIPVKISVTPYMHALPGYLADKNGLYKDASFDYSISMYASGPPQNEALASNTWEVGSMGSGGAILGAIGYNLKIIGFTAGDTNTTDLWVRPNSPLAKTKGQNSKYPNILGTPEQWKGLNIIYPSATSAHMVVLTALDALGLKETDIKKIDMSVPNAFPAFKAGQGDMVALWSPFGYLAEKEGWIKVASAADLNVILPCLIVASEKAVKERPEVVQKWLETYLKGAEELRKDSAKAADLLYTYSNENGIKLSKEDALLEIKNRPFPTLAEQKKLFDKTGKQSTDAETILIKYVDFLVSQGSVKPEDRQKLIANKFVDGSFMEKVK